MEDTQQDGQNSVDNKYLNTETGTNEGNKALDPKPVLITGISLKTKNKEGKVMDTPLIEIIVKHPDRAEPVKLTKIKQLIGEKVVVTSLFVSVDNDGKFMKDSGIAKLLLFNNVKTLAQLVTKTMDTLKESESSKYLALKCY